MIIISTIITVILIALYRRGLAQAEEIGQKFLRERKYWLSEYHRLLDEARKATTSSEKDRLTKEAKTALEKRNAVKL